MRIMETEISHGLIILHNSSSRHEKKGDRLLLYTFIKRAAEGSGLDRLTENIFD
jgi:hypothetical protein